MMPVIIISVLYAVIRAKHDSYVNNGPWKRWAFIEGVLVAVSVGYLAGENWIDWIFLTVIFAYSFWIVFDIACGIFRAGKLWHFGSGWFDQKMKRVFVSGYWYAVYKAIWLIIITGVYNSL